jgi:alkylated DNA repair dioxygenase AlkB
VIEVIKAAFAYLDHEHPTVRAALEEIRQLQELARRTVSGQEAQPIYQARSINSVTWTDQSKDGYDHMAKYPMCFEVRIVCAAPIPATDQEKP